MKLTTTCISLLISMLFGCMTIFAQQPPQCRLMGCVHSGNDAVLIISISNPNPNAIKCTLVKSGLHSLKAEADDGRTFTDIQCYADSKCIAAQDICSPLSIYPNERKYVTMVINDVPEDMDKFHRVSLLLRHSDDDSVKFDFSNINVVAENISLPD